MLHVADAANCVAAKNGGKNENARLPSLFPDLSRDEISASRGPSRFVTSHSRSRCQRNRIRIRPSIKVSVHNLKNLILKLKALITKKTYAKSLRFENVIF